MTPLDLHVHLYVVARLGGLMPKKNAAAALRAILSRSFPVSEPPPIAERRLARSTLKEQGASPFPVPGVDFGFSAISQASWITNDALPDFRDMPRAWKTPTTARTMFDRGHAVYDAVESFAKNKKASSAWRRGRLKVSSILTSADETFLSELLEGVERTIDSIRPLGLPAIGSAGGVVWIGMTDDVSFFDETDPKKRAAVIREVNRRPEQAFAECTETVDHKVGAWKERFDNLSAQAQDLVAVMSVLRRFGYGVLAVEVVREAFSSIRNVLEFDRAFAELQRSGWLRTDWLGLIHTPVLRKDFFCTDYVVAGGGYELTAVARAVLRSFLASAHVERSDKERVANNYIFRILAGDGSPELALMEQFDCSSAAPGS